MPFARSGLSATAAIAGLLLSHSAFAQASVADIANYAKPDRQKMLEDGARREGAVLIYTTGTTTQPIMDKFRARYPFIKLEVWRGDSVEVTRKTMEEYQAGRYDVDAFELSTAGLIPMRDTQILQPFATPETASFIPEAIEPNRFWASTRVSYTGVGFNTKAVSREDAPKTYRDMLDPKWKSRMAISGSLGTAGNWVGAMVLADGVDYVRALGRQNMRVYQASGRAVANLMISGEVTISPNSYYDHVTSSKTEGAPLDWIAPGPVPVLDTAVAITSRAKHPHAAMLFVDFMIGREAQEMLGKLFYVSPRTDMPKGDLPEFKKLFLANRPNYIQEFEGWAKLLNEAFVSQARQP